MRVHGEPLAAPERAGEVRVPHTAWCCVVPCSRRSRATSACLRNVPLSVRLQRPIPRRRWSVGTDGTHCSPQVMGSFDTILVVLGMLLQHASSTKQVLLTAPAQPARTQRSPTAGCAPWVAGGCRTLPFDVVSMAAKRQSSAVAWWHAGARAVHRVPASVCRRCPERLCMRSGWLLTVDPGAPGQLAELYGPTAELGGLGSTRVAGVGT